jgi:protein SCO1/2
MSSAAPKHRSLAAPVALFLALALLTGVAVKRALQRGGKAETEAAAEGGAGHLLADWGKVADVTLTDQDGRPFALSSLRGKVYVLDFIFTTCSGPCVPMTDGMRTIARDLAAQPDAEFVSVTVDPQNDTPPVLKSFASVHGGRMERWHWLTGDKQAIFDLAHDSFFAPVGDKLPEGNVLHSTRYFVVDREGHLRAMHDTQSDPDPQHGPIRGVVDTVKQLLAAPAPAAPDAAGR